MHIIHITSELAPIAKTGGLGDVVYGLCKELIKQGHKVQIILPKYDIIPLDQLKNLQIYYKDLWSYEGNGSYPNTIWSANFEDLELFLIDHHHPSNPFNRGTIYGPPDDIDRFFYFSRTCMEFLFKSNLRPDILHVHDWPTAILPILQRDMYSFLGWAPIKTVLTIHNLEHQGRCFPHHLNRIGLPGNDYLFPERLQDPINLELVNALKGGILYADAITTVSPSYKKEIMTSQHGFGLQEILSKNQRKLHGVLNGIDENFWNPEIDPYLEFPFESSPPFTEKKWPLIQKNKKLNKERLRSLLNLPTSNTPLVSCIGRLVEQKGPRLIAHAFRQVLSLGGQCVILGSPYSKEIEKLFLELESSYNSNPNGKIILGYDEALSHKIFAASDILLIPSLFEPCGLTQMIALRYGTIPIVRKTGGLADTIIDIEDKSSNPSDRNGFVFHNPTEEELSNALTRAFTLWEKNPIFWQKLMQQGMTQNFSWEKAALNYLEIYRN